MATSRVLSSRVQLDAELENLERMLPHWRGTLRHEAQFMPQFDALVKEILAHADPADHAYAQQRIERMLVEHVPVGGARRG